MEFNKGFKTDQQIKKRPECAVPACKDSGWILVANQFVCGRCAKKAAEYSNKMIFEKLSQDIAEIEGS